MNRLVRRLQNCDRRRVYLTLVVLAAIIVRIAVMFYFETYSTLRGPGLISLFFAPKHDHFGFGYETGSIAFSIATGKGFSSPFGLESGPTAWIAPVYPYLCALVFKLFGVFSQTSGIVILSLNSVFEGLVCIFIVRIGEKTVGASAGWFAAWVWALGLFFSRWATTWVWDMSLSALLLAIAVDQTLGLADQRERKPWILFAVTWGTIALSNPSLMAVLPVCALWLVWKQRRIPWDFVRNGLLATAVFCALITPWLVRNRVVFDRWVFIRSNAGFEFSLGNYPSSNGMGWFGLHPSQNQREFDRYKQQGELAYINGKKSEATAWVKRDPLAFIRLSAKRCYDFWYGTLLEYDPHDMWRPWMYYWVTLATIAGLWLGIRRGTYASVMLAGVIACFPLPYYVTFTHARYRHAVEPIMLLAVAYAALAPVQVVRSWRKNRGAVHFDSPASAVAETVASPEPVLR